MDHVPLDTGRFTRFVFYLMRVTVLEDKVDEIHMCADMSRNVD